MSPDRWERVKELFETALARAAPDRAGYVALACEGDESLRTEVERLLADYDRAGSFLEGTPSLPSGSDDLQIGHIVSHYEIVTKLGQGGMGTVYKAVDSHSGVTLQSRYSGGSRCANSTRRNGFCGKLAPRLR